MSSIDFFLTSKDTPVTTFLIRHRAPARSVCGFRLLSSQLDSSKILDSKLEYLLEVSKDPPKTAAVNRPPFRAPT